VSGKPVPNHASFLATLEHVRHDGNRRWRNSSSDRLYEWDALHGELEVYNARGDHLGALDPESGALVKGAVKGRTINV
jgi:hypothetical protein